MIGAEGIGLYAVSPRAVSGVASVDGGVVYFGLPCRLAVRIVLLVEVKAKGHGMCFFVGSVPSAIEDTELGVSREDGEELCNVNIVGTRPLAVEISAIGRDTTAYLMPLVGLLVAHHDLRGHVPVGGSVSPCTHSV